MKLNLALATAILAMTPAAAAWRVRFYSNANYGGSEFTRAGEGGTGTACGSVPDWINDEISSFRWWPENTAGTTSCCLYLYRDAGCQGKLDWAPACMRNDVPNLQGTALQDKISSFRTECFRLE
ncbi:hypothetical protein BJY04DRAFT_223182 [Aspergillus karnatakaensis]|uniref:uncharacterized protein n=1 Tax=Aspergillus karnatakaensis TaxID=1810916 RepID=UPI003CCCF09E